jgi:hypothetical protein
MHTIYEVNVKLISVFETFKSWAKGFNAGKYMLPETGEKKPAHDAIKTMNLFWLVVNTECIGPAAEAVVAVRCMVAFRGTLSLVVDILSIGSWLS